MTAYRLISKVKTITISLVLSVAFFNINAAENMRHAFVCSGAAQQPESGATITSMAKTESLRNKVFNKDGDIVLSYIVKSAKASGTIRNGAMSLSEYNQLQFTPAEGFSIVAMDMCCDEDVAIDNLSFNSGEAACNGNHYIWTGDSSQPVTATLPKNQSALYFYYIDVTYRKSGTTAIENITEDYDKQSDSDAEYFDISGRPLGVDKPTTPGLYIRRQNNKSAKILIK